MFGSSILRFDTVSSTNDVARELAVSGASEGTCIVAREQTAGRGRLGRAWSSPEGEGLYLSIILRPSIKASDSAVLTLAAAIAVAETLGKDFNALVDIKWPNDVLASGRKICGILIESAVEGDAIQFAIAGIGINLSQRSFPSEIGDAATSLLLETNKAVTTAEVLKPLLDQLERWYNVATAKAQEVITRWQELSSFARDCAVKVESAEGAVEGVTRGLSSSGALIIELAGGELREVVSGEVSLRKSVVSSQ